ncbi:MAG: glycosyltransferase [Tannerella sp.]|jgi:glycosyltransferase involved in cell wall biosynthesis|nr:glycosyltransferase [Tannerella sp.]
MVNSKKILENGLSVIIPTYNRKDRLINQLKSIFKQSQYHQINIIILDNNSDYDISSELKNTFSEPELLKTEITKRPYNIGAIGNISTSFLYSKTKWMWLLSDDDETTLISLETILHNIEQYPDTAVFKYSICGESIPEEEKVISSIDEYIKYYKNGGHTSGNMIFISNNVFNLELLNPYLGYANIYSYTNIPHVMPVIAGLADKKVKMKFCPEAIVKYIPPVPGSGWDYTPTLLGLSSVTDISQSIKLTRKQLNELSGLLARNFSHAIFIEKLSSVKDRKIRKAFYEKIFRNLFIHHGPKWIYYFVFYFTFYSGINVIGICRKIRGY